MSIHHPNIAERVPVFFVVKHSTSVPNCWRIRESDEYHSVGRFGNQLDRDDPMFEFFRGWKRKVGCESLAIACSVAVAWVRSLNDGDVFCIQCRGDYYSLHSAKGNLRWGTDQLDHVTETSSLNGTPSRLSFHLTANPPILVADVSLL